LRVAVAVAVAEAATSRGIISVMLVVQCMGLMSDERVAFYLGYRSTSKKIKISFGTVQK
jgi:hypothetical protein